MSAVRNRANFRETTRERPATFVEFRCTAHAELGRRAPRALGNTHDVGTVCGKVSVAFGGEIALSYRVLSGNIGVISEFENRQSRQFCMKTKMNVEKARREAMHMS